MSHDLNLCNGKSLSIIIRIIIHLKNKTQHNTALWWQQENSAGYPFFIWKHTECMQYRIWAPEESKYQDLSFMSSTHLTKLTLTSNWDVKQLDKGRLPLALTN